MKYLPILVLCAVGCVPEEKAKSPEQAEYMAFLKRKLPDPEGVEILEFKHVEAAAADHPNFKASFRAKDTAGKKVVWHGQMWFKDGKIMIASAQCDDPRKRGYLFTITEDNR